MEYLILYKVIGIDHDGYCSGADADECQPIIPYLELHLVRSDNQPDLTKYSYCNKGCTSGGSGYCNGFGQNHTAMKVFNKIGISSLTKNPVFTIGELKFCLTIVNKDNNIDGIINSWKLMSEHNVEYFEYNNYVSQRLENIREIFYSSFYYKNPLGHILPKVIVDIILNKLFA